MEQQLSFFGQDDSSRRKYNLFLALLPDGQITRVISDFRESLERQHGPLGRLVPAEHYHITLVDLGEYYDEIPKSEIRRVSAGCEMAVRIPGFPISLDQVRTWGSTLVLLGLKSPPLMEFRSSLLECLMRQGLRCKGNSTFTPHLTLSRGSTKIPQGPIEPITWDASEVVLIGSSEGTHTHLGRWSLSRGA